MRFRFSDPFILLTALICVLLAAPAHADPLTNSLCAVESSNMEDVARNRDAGKSEASAQADQNGDIENKIVSLIYQLRQYRPAQIKVAALKVCTETDGFAHGVGVPNDANLGKIDASILQAIRMQLAQH